MRQLCIKAGSYRAAAELIAGETGRPMSLDAIKSWTCDYTSKRARTCADWSIAALEKALEKREKAETLTA